MSCHVIVPIIMNTVINITEAQHKAAKDIVDSLDLMKASSDGGELLKPSSTFNPVLQRFYQVLEKYDIIPYTIPFKLR